MAACNPPLELTQALDQMPPHHLNLMGYVDRSEVNGPGMRAVVWVQRSIRDCPGCNKTDSWSFEPNQIVAVDDR